MTIDQIPAPIREVSSIDQTSFEEDIRPAAQPVVIRGLATDWPGVKAARQGERAIVDYLLSFHPARPVSGIMAPPAAGRRFFYNPDMTGFNFTRQQGRLDVFLDGLLKVAEDENPPAMAVQSEIIPDILPGFVDANPMPLAPQVKPRIWIGNRIHVAPHYDLMENIAVCLAGRRKFTVFPPDQLPNLYPGPFEVTPAGTPVSMVDPENPDLDRFPRFAEAWAHAQQTILEPGDALYLPFAWWHGVEALEPVSILVNYWWANAPEGSRPGYDALLHAMMAYRHLPADQRAVWRMVFEHYIFSGEDTASHLPPHARGVQSEASPALFEHMRNILRDILK